MAIVMLSSYIAVVVFIIGVALKWRKWSTMPIHLRWELYPVPHEAGRHHYGGSYMEEVDWWRKPRRTTMLGELKELFSEMLFIKRVYKYKRSLWWLTYPFHGGLYLILVWFALLLIRGIVEAYTVIDPAAQYVLTSIDGPVRALVQVTGSVGIAAATFGCIGLLIRRIIDSDMRKYSSGLDFFNLLFILAVLLTGIGVWASDVNFENAMRYMSSLLSFNSIKAPDLSPLAQVHVVLMALLWIYIPFSKMSHFFGKFFTYHRVLWEDEPNIRGGDIEVKIREILKLKVPWSAPHMITGKSWEENAVGE
ncbi:MAG: respiratory nitrate reductase subunit gamma [Candidatus Methanodesulfokora sp.]